MKVIPIPHDTASLKAIRKKYGSESDVRQYLKEELKYIQEEIEIMKKLEGELNVVYFQQSEIRPRTDIYGWDVLICMDRLIRLDHYFANRSLVPGAKHFQSTVLSMLVDILRALSVCEQQHIVHLDVKPENIFYAPGTQQFKLSDFGVSARRGHDLASKGVRVGTMEYMAPEIYNYAGGDSRADVYSLALVVYEMLNGGCLPYMDINGAGANARDYAARYRLSGSRAVPPIKGVSRKVMAVLYRCLSFRPEDRYGTAREAYEAACRLRVQSFQDSATHIKLSVLLALLGLGVIVMLLIGILTILK